ncbi:hypothetical protein [Leuconostoc falkenbergense]|nr:hypothetical protein [Leuconostoc falkenbergense]
MQNSAKSSWVTDKLMPPIMKFINTKAVTALKNGMVVDCKIKPNT